MADALQTEVAPSKKERAQQSEIKLEKQELTKEQIALSQKFDTKKKYMFELAEKNMQREQPIIDMVTKRQAAHIDYKPYQNIVLTSQIVWNGERRMIRYYDGCTSLLASIAART